MHYQIKASMFIKKHCQKIKLQFMLRLRTKPKTTDYHAEKENKNEKQS